jgi:hypothetical protein
MSRSGGAVAPSALQAFRDLEKALQEERRLYRNGNRRRSIRPRHSNHEAGSNNASIGKVVDATKDL